MCLSKIEEIYDPPLEEEQTAYKIMQKLADDKDEYEYAPRNSELKRLSLNTELLLEKLIVNDYQTYRMAFNR